MRMNAAILLGLLLSTACSLKAIEELPVEQHRWTDGAYSTLTMPFNCPKVVVKNLQTLYVALPGAKEKIVVLASIQPSSAPLVILIPGTFGKPDNPEIQLWMSWLASKGWSVAAYPSTFLATTNKASPHGVAGCLEEEAGLAGRIIQALLDHPQVKGRVERIGVVGLSYGGIQALLLSVLQGQGRLPFQIDAVQAYSPPVSVKKSMEWIDRHFTHDYKLTELFWKYYNLRREYPLSQQMDRKMMEAAIARVFRLGLENVVELNDRLYRKELKDSGGDLLEIPEDAETLERMEYAKVVSFTQYYQQMVWPYWKKKRGIQSTSALLRCGELSWLLPRCNTPVRVILASNDPLNAEGAVDEIRSTDPRCTVVHIHRGGHLGYANAEWTRTQLERLFDTAPIQVAVSLPEDHPAQELVSASPEPIPASWTTRQVRVVPAALTPMKPKNASFTLPAPIRALLVPFTGATANTSEYIVQGE